MPSYIQSVVSILIISPSLSPEILQHTIRLFLIF